MEIYKFKENLTTNFATYQVGDIVFKDPTSTEGFEYFIPKKGGYPLWENSQLRFKHLLELVGETDKPPSYFTHAKYTQEQFDELTKAAAITFGEYYKRYRHEEGVSFKRECERIGGIFSLADIGAEKIYDKFINGEEIESVSMPGVIYKFPIGENPIVIMPDKKTSE